MNKILSLFMTAALICLSLGACQNSSEATANPEAPASRPASDIRQNAESIPPANPPSSENGDPDLRLLSNRYGDSACNTENGYYYLTEETTKLSDGSYGTHLMYMDYASGREIYLCSTTGCQHDSPDCPAVFLNEDFPPSSTLLFIFQDNLYILSREYDDDGSVSREIITAGDDDASVESRPAILYRANLDGTERQKIYTFDSALTLEDKIIGNNTGIYVITKKLSADKDGTGTYITSSERKLMFLDLGSPSLKEICRMDFDDHISWQLIGCYQNDFLLCGTDFGRELSRDEDWNDEVHKDLYLNSSKVYALLNQNEGRPKEIVRQSNQYSNAAELIGNCLYLSSSENQNIEEVHLETGERRILCSLPQNLIIDTLGDMLCCRDWNLAEDPIWYFVDTKTGTITHTPLVNLCNGWALEFRGETASDVLFVYDYDAVGHEDGSYEIYQYKHAWISKEDLFAGNDNYRKVEMIGPGH